MMKKIMKMNKIAVCVLFAVLFLCMAGSCVLADRVDSNFGDPASQSVDPGSYCDAPATVQAVPVYCFYSSFMKDHMWTASEYEKTQLEDLYKMGVETYRYLRIWGYAEQTQTDRNIPVYRFWNKKTTDHFYTISSGEKDQLAKDLENGTDDYVYEGIAWYVPTTSNHPVYRFFDTKDFNHYYTSDELLMRSLSQAYLNGTGTYRYEGIAWYWYE